MGLTYSVTTTYVSLQEKFGDWLAGRGASASTVKSYLRDLAVFTRWFEGANRQGFDVHYLTSADLRAWREHSLRVEHIMPTTWNRRLAMLRNLAAWAREGGLIEHDPLRGVLRARDGRKTAPRSLEKPDFGRLMRQLELDVMAANTPRRRALAILEHFTVTPGKESTRMYINDMIEILREQGCESNGAEIGSALRHVLNIRTSERTRDGFFAYGVELKTGKERQDQIIKTIRENYSFEPANPTAEASDAEITKCLSDHGLNVSEDELWRILHHELVLPTGQESRKGYFVYGLEMKTGN